MQSGSRTLPRLERPNAAAENSGAACTEAVQYHSTMLRTTRTLAAQVQTHVCTAEMCCLHEMEHGGPLHAVSRVGAVEKSSVCNKAHEVLFSCYLLVAR